MTFSIVLTFVVWHALYAPRVLHYDFSQGHDLGTVNWPADRREDFWWLGRRPNNVTIEVLGRVYKAEGTAGVSLQRRGQLISRVKVSESPVTLDGAIARVKALSQDWGFETHTIEQWRRGALAGDLSRYSAGIPTDGFRPEMMVHIIPAAATRNRPWYMQFTIYWPREEANQR